MKKCAICGEKLDEHLMQCSRGHSIFSSPRSKVYSCDTRLVEKILQQSFPGIAEEEIAYLLDEITRVFIRNRMPVTKEKVDLIGNNLRQGLLECRLREEKKREEEHKQREEKARKQREEEARNQREEQARKEREEEYKQRYEEYKQARKQREEEYKRLEEETRKQREEKRKQIERRAEAGSRARRLRRPTQHIQPDSSPTFGVHEDYEADIPVVARLNDIDMQAAILEYIMNANLKACPLPPAQEADVAVSTNQQFWDLARSNQRRIGLKWIKLDGFSLLDWFPRSPGLYYKESAQQARHMARDYLRMRGNCLVYEPEGKVHMINGGVGSLRFKPTKIFNEDCWLCTATSDSYCHTGVPVAIPSDLFDNWDYDYDNIFEITGQIRYVPKLLEQYYSHMSQIPQFYILVESINRLRRQSNSRPLLISPLVFFSTLGDKYAAFVNCSIKEDSQISEAANWILDYVEGYSGEVLTNFDQQQPQFCNAPFALEKLMNGQITIHDVERLDIGRANLICEAVQKIQSIETTLVMNNQGDVYNVGQAGAVGKYARSYSNTFVQSEQKQTLANAAEEIQNLLKQLEQVYPNATVTDKVAYVNDETTPGFKRRVVGALQAGSEAAIEDFLDNPYVNVVKAIVKGWIKPE
jgi:actin-related protein